jgi:hypothetical protein
VGNFISKKLAPIALAFVIAGCHSPRDIPDDSEPSHGYANFITTLASLCKTNKYILLGDTDHGAPVVREMTADPAVIQTLKDCGSTLVIEDGGIKENEGYKTPRYTPEPQQTRDSILTVQKFLKQKFNDPDVNLTGVWDKETNKSFSTFITALNNSGDSLSDLMASLSASESVYDPSIPQKITKDFGSGRDVKAFLKALKYLDETAQLPVKTTEKTKYQDIQAANGANWTGREHLDDPKLADNRNLARALQAQLNRLYEAAMKGVPIVYPDPRHEELNKDMELASAIFETTYKKQIRTTDDEINLAMTLDARANKDLKFRQAFNRLSKLMEYSLSEPLNGQIAENIKALAGANPAVILYGSAHMTEARDLDEMLGQESAVTILLKTRRDQVFITDPPGSRKKPTVTYEDTPQYIYDIHQDRMTKIMKGEPSEQAYRSMVRYGITKQEYDRSIKAMPEDLRPYALPYSYYDSNPHNDGIPVNWLETDVIYKNTPG